MTPPSSIFVVLIHVYIKVKIKDGLKLLCFGSIQNHLQGVGELLHLEFREHQQDTAPPLFEELHNIHV